MVVVVESERLSRNGNWVLKRRARAAIGGFYGRVAETEMELEGESRIGS